MARKQKLLSKSTANLTVLQQEAKFKAEFLAADGLPELQRTPPNHLKGAAKQEYKRIVQSVGKLPLRNLDRAELENYCTWYGVYKQISLELSESDKDGRDKLISQLDKATKNIKGLASDLGLNVNSRMQMNMPKIDEDKPKSIKGVFG
ncbi:P27 family phage terminase small subunit [Liquorilactobacillus nagelii]|jgi:P27 family predicted phage terminase small subunit|uniref:P27 family phage terminase small subunit n=1 Tax=Liquorilactobacillus nagelii TaxID=82688 RepID=UPI002430BAB9|nr:P27 family phage terminase small subunit [Liquorilactobacillus nagelii]MCI1699460.1 P27 family phage terminase small subunit [Liquorilactobacillus nagelii]